MAKDKAEKPTKETIQPAKEPLFPVEDLAEENGLLSWETAALMAATSWAQGKQVTKSVFEAALTKLRNRPQGGGRV